MPEYPAPPGVRHQVRTVTVRVEQLPDGKFRLSTPAARGWAAVGRTPQELGRAVSSAFAEAQCAAYARWRGERYDLDDLTEPVSGDPLAGPRRPLRPRANRSNIGYGRNQDRPDTHPVEAWERLPNGRLRSPNGLTYGPDTLIGQRVLERARKQGIPL
jgi:hypothetical protein